MTPILNENDAVATEEIKFGDNDSLSAKVADVMGAERLVILTDVEGLYDSDPPKTSEAPGAQLSRGFSEIACADRHSRGSSRGTGGMYSKLRAAQEASRKGIEAWLMKGDLPDVLSRVAKNETVGTCIRARWSMLTMKSLVSPCSMPLGIKGTFAGR